MGVVHNRAQAEPAVQPVPRQSLGTSFRCTHLPVITYHASMRCLFFTLCLVLVGCNSSSETPELAWGKRGIQPGDFIRPRAITIGTTQTGEEELYIVDFAGRIQVFDLEGKPLRNWRTPTIENGRPAGLGWSAKKQQLIVADSHYQQMLFYSPEGELLRKIPGTLGAGNLGPFQYVADVAEDTAGNLYVSEFGNENQDRIRKLTPDGEHIKSWGGHGTGPGEFSRPRGLAISPQLEIYVADANNHRIQVFTLEGNYLRTIGTHGSGPGELQYPYDVALGAKGDVYVAEWGQHRIQKFASSGKSLGTWGHAGREPGCLFQPWGIVATKNGKVFVLDSENHRVQRISW